ncbi:MAG: hypothetical protein ACTS3R_17210 [Inquilinaceae bacterium]
MRPMSVIGIVLIVVGIIVLVVPYIPFTTEETVLQVGPAEVTAERERAIALPAALGGIVLVVGVILAFLGRRKG